MGGPEGGALRVGDRGELVDYSYRTAKDVADVAVGDVAELAESIEADAKGVCYGLRPPGAGSG
jgi:hypothetical protein